MMWVGLIFISWNRQQSPSQSMHSSSGSCCLCRVLAGVCAIDAASKWSHIGSGICPKNRSYSKGLRSYCSEWVEEAKLENRGTKAARLWKRKSKLNIKVCLERWEEPQKSPELPNIHRGTSKYADGSVRWEQECEAHQRLWRWSASIAQCWQT